jgi:VanZ family protein
MTKSILRWIPAITMMFLIFLFSSIPSNSMPGFGIWDLLVKKGGHATVYSLLALTFGYALRWDTKRFLLAWILATLYAISDEFHQSFTPGRNAWWVDVALDSASAALTLWVVTRWKIKNDQRSQAGHS